jgi:hypothetical protein
VFALDGGESPPATAFEITERGVYFGEICSAIQPGRMDERAVLKAGAFDVLRGCTVAATLLVNDGSPRRWYVKL